MQMAKSVRRQAASKASKSAPASPSRSSKKTTATSRKSPSSRRPSPHEQIEALDRELIRIVQQRAELSHATIQAGVVTSMFEATTRARQMVQASTGQVSTAAMQAILKHVASACLANMHRMRVAYLGPQYSYTHLAAIKYFGEAAAFAPVASIAAVFEAVTRNEAIAGLVPIENSTDGRIVDTLSMFIRRKMHVCGEVVLPIHHNLLSRTPRERIVEVYSKPQALSQCRNWLANNVPQAKLVDMSSTTAAAQIAAEKPGAAAIASIEAGREYSLDVIDANIEDNPHNFTRFAVLGREQLAPTGDDKTAIMFQVNHEPGALADSMTIFKKAQLNLTFIESFPIPDRINEYVFFIELTGHQADKNVAAAIETLSKRSQRVDVLGSYPKATV